MLLGFKQPRILDGDHGLIGEGLKKGDLPLGEELCLGAAQRDHSNRDTFSHQRDTKYRVKSLAPCIFAAFGKFVRLGLDISNVEGPLIEN